MRRACTSRPKRIVISLRKYKNQTIKEYIHKKAANLLVPYFLYSILIFIIFFLVTRISTIHELLSGSFLACDNLKSLFCGILLGNNEQCNHLWFIYALFFIEVIAFVCVKKVSVPWDSWNPAMESIRSYPPEHPRESDDTPEGFLTEIS